MKGAWDAPFETGHALPGQPPSVDGQHVSGHVLRGLRAQEHRRAGDVFRGAQSAPPSRLGAQPESRTVS